MSDSKRRTTTGIKLNDEERAELRRLANQYDISIGRYLKHVAVKQPLVVVEAADPLLIRHIARVGCNINQIAAALNRIAIMGGANSNFQAWVAGSLDDIRADLKRLVS